MSNEEIISQKTLKKVGAVAGGAAGAAGASAIGGIVGGGGLLSTVGGYFGLTVAAATPVGWIVGGAAAGATALYLLTSTSGKKGYSDGNYSAMMDALSDEEKKKFHDISAKLLGEWGKEGIQQAKEYLSKLPDEYDDHKVHLGQSLDTGFLAPSKVIEIVCQLLNEPFTYEEKRTFSIPDMQFIIRMGHMMGLADGELLDEESRVIREKVVEAFSLSENLDEEEIDFIFSYALKNEKQEDLSSQGHDKLQAIMAMALDMIEDKELKEKTISILRTVALADGSIDQNESNLLNMLDGILRSEDKFHRYESAFKELKSFSVSSSELYSVESENQEKYEKKLSNALSSYASGINPKQVVCLYDSTLFGKADEGMVITPAYVITTLNRDGQSIIPLADIGRVEDSKEELILKMAPNMHGEVKVVAKIKKVIYPETLTTFFESIAKINQDEKDIWHIAHNNEQLGEHTLFEIKQKLENGSIPLDGFLVWKEGQESWLDASEVEEINILIQNQQAGIVSKQVKTPPPLPTA